jgi:hypothetical protein
LIRYASVVVVRGGRASDGRVQGDASGGFEQLERALFAVLVESYPGLWSLEEIVVELADDPDRFEDRDSVGVAVRELVRRWLIRRVASSYVATRAAVHAFGLVD